MFVTLRCAQFHAWVRLLVIHVELGYLRQFVVEYLLDAAHEI